MNFDIMRKRKPGYYPKHEEKLGGSDWLLVAPCLALPFIAVALATFVLVTTITPDVMSFWVALPVMLIGSALFLLLGIVSSGTDLMDIVVPSLVMIVLSLLLWPTLARAKAHRLEKKGLTLQQPPSI